MVNVWAENLWAYPDSIDNSDRSASQGRNSFHYVDSTTARGPSNGYVRALEFAWWQWWNYSLTLYIALRRQMMIILWSRVDMPWRKAVNLISLAGPWCHLFYLPLIGFEPFKTLIQAGCSMHCSQDKSWHGFAQSDNFTIWQSDKCSIWQFDNLPIWQSDKCHLKASNRMNSVSRNNSNRSSWAMATSFLRSVNW